MAHAIITLARGRRADPSPSGLSHPVPSVAPVHAPPSLPVPTGLVTCQALVAYDADARDALVGLKNRDERARVSWWADQLAALAPSLDQLVVTWAPTSGSRRRHRGFDHAELLARAVARRRQLRVVPLLRRLPGVAQAGRTAAERAANPAFVARRRCPHPVLLVDDVATTGATLEAAAEALRGVGVPAVHGLVVARAPRPGGR
jgi:predicted amidophosphoribosyltransferase